MVFARETGDTLTSLVKKLDSAVSSGTKLHSFVVFLNDDEKFADQLKALAEKEGIKNVILAVDNLAGPKGYDIAKDADVTVILYNKRKVEANHAFRKGELNGAAIDRIVADLPKILPSADKK